MAAIATKKRKSNKRTQSMAGNPVQPPLPAMEDVDERIPELDEVCDLVLSIEERRRLLKVELDGAYEDIGELIKEHSLEFCVLKGEKFFIKPAGERVTHEKFKRR